MMGKVMNKQVAGQPRAEAPALSADGLKGAPKGDLKKAGEGQEFEAQLMQQAALMTPQAQMQQPQAQAPAQAVAQEGTEAKAPVAITAEAAKAGAQSAPKVQAAQQAQQAKPSSQPALTLKSAASPNTGSALAGLNQGPSRIGDWVFEGLSPLDPQTQQAQGPSPAQAPVQGQVAGERSPVASRGEADQARASQAPAAYTDTALEEQLASLGGVIEGLVPKPQGSGPGAAGVPGRGIAQGPKGQRVQGGAHALSGGEFLSTLGAAKGGMVASRSEQDDLLQGEQRKGEGKGSAIGGKPSLKVIQGGGKGLKSELEAELTASRSLGHLAGSHGAGAHGTASAGRAMLATEVTGHVVQGANAEQRLSSEALIGITSGLRGFAGQNGGEMRIRLKPENLGELHVRVMTDGKSVGLQIQASDESAKKILEESLTHLKDSLAAQNLSLGAVDLTVASSQGSAGGDNRGQGHAHGQSAGMFNDMLGQQGAGHGAQHREGREGAWSGNGGDAGISPRASRPGAIGASAAAFGARPVSGDGGRLDVRA